jgi:hypothetical protein
MVGIAGRVGCIQQKDAEREDDVLGDLEKLGLLFPLVIYFS